jgi:hypothetical protein
MRWESAALREADAEEQERDQSPDRLTPAYYLRDSKGRFTVWIAADGTPLSSESATTATI